ncbi:MAG TPA: amino acid ABC transporter ATP-binding protein [Fibrobacteria bacterium]|nr:amino acid ABC transporter ATP-binding protein [Fibrobacteria bacterium]
MEARDVHKSYGSVQVLRGVSFQLFESDSIVIIGPSGSGKSTLLRCLAALEPVDQGTITYQGIELKADRDTRTKIGGDIGMVFQSFALFPHLSVLQNITLAPIKVRGKNPKEAEATAYDLLAKVGLQDKAHAYPQELSGGQKQRVAIARALAMDPRLMLFDEPTSALDPELTKEVLDVMVQLVEEGMSVVVVTHEMGFARRAANRVIFMDEGKIVEDGPTAEVFDNPREERTRRFLREILSY